MNTDETILNPTLSSPRSYADALTTSPPKKGDLGDISPPDPSQLRAPVEARGPEELSPGGRTQDPFPPHSPVPSLLDFPALEGAGRGNRNVPNLRDDGPQEDMGHSVDTPRDPLAQVEDQQGWQTVTPRKARRKERRAARIKEQNKGPYADPPLEDKGARRHAKKTTGDGGSESHPSPTLSLSTLGYTDEESANMEVDQDPFAGSTPKASQPRRGDPDDVPHPVHVLSQPPPQQLSALPPGGGAPNPTAEEPQSARDLPPHVLAQSQQAGAGTPPHRTGEDQILRAGRLRRGDRGDSPMVEASPPPPAHEDLQTLEGDAPELWIETTSENVTTNGKGLRRTATPEGGWPQIHLAAAPTFNIAPSTLREWEGISGPTLWVRLYRGRYEPLVAGRTNTVDACKSVVKNLVFVEHDEDLAVVFPDQDLPAESDNKFPHPYHLLVTGLQQQQIDRLAELQVVSTPESTLIFLPQQAPRPLYILTISGLTYQDTPRAQTLVEELARNTFYENPEIRAFVEGRAGPDTEEALRQTLALIRVSFILLKSRNESTRAWNVYFATDPGLNDEDYSALRQKMRQSRFNTVGFGKGYTLTGRQQPHCTGCKSVDHDSSNCPFSKIPGWFGYRPGGNHDTAGTTDFVDTAASGDEAVRRQGSREARRGYGARRGRSGFSTTRGRGRAMPSLTLYLVYPPTGKMIQPEAMNTTPSGRPPAAPPKLA
ncbi:hypothetical protein C0992_009081 [Termitomyces sp. T32_za158]|nr:hypothetical protein C0992_009081 [Termitomyces sp. T32_za158]